MVRRVAVPLDTPAALEARRKIKVLTQTTLRAALDKQLKHMRQKVTKAEDPVDSLISALSLGPMAHIDSELGPVAQDAGWKFLAQINVPRPQPLFDRVSDRAVSWASDHAAELVTGVEETTVDGLRTLISDGLEENIGLDAISQRIQDSYLFSEERAALIAQTEVAAANQQGVLEGMEAAEAAGVHIQKVWLPDDEACDVCLDNASDGPIPLDEEFSSGDDRPPAHPNCRCNMISEIEETGEVESAGDASDEE